MIRDAGAVLATRGTGVDAPVLLALRSPALGFFGGYWACPGGIVEPDDGEPGSEAAARAAAARELAEETGLSLEPSELRAFARFTTPPFSTRRVRTTFFHAVLPADAALRADGEEILALRVEPASAALARWNAFECPVVPPAVVLLELLAAATVDEATARAGRSCAEVEAGRPLGAPQAPGVLAVPLRTPTLPPATTTNTYVLGTDELVVVDPATWEADERARLFALLDGLRDAGRRVVAVVATHHHVDHVGSVGATAERYGVPVRGHPLTLERLPATKAERVPLEDGGRLDLGRAPDGADGWHLEALHTPGHDRGHLVLRDSRHGWVVAGDLASTSSTIVIDPPEGHLATYLASLRRVRERGLSMLFPAHGLAARDGTALVDAYLAHRREREEALLTALRRGVERETELVRAVYTDVDPALHALARRSLVAGLEKLAEEGRAEPSGDRWRAVPGAVDGGIL